MNKETIKQNTKNLQAALNKLTDDKNILDAVLNSLPGIFYMFNQKGKFVKWNKNFEIVSGCSYDEVSKSSPLDYFTFKTKKRIAAKILTVFTKGDAEVEGDFVTKSGKKIPYYFTGLRTKIKNKTYLIGVGLDISERKQAEKKIQKSEKFNRAITETAVDAIITINSHGDVLSWNSAATKIFGYTSAEMKNKNLSKILPEQYESGHNKGVERLKGGGRKKIIGKTIEIAAKKKDGTEFPVELSLSSWEVDNQVNYTGVIRDISRRKNFELQQSVIYQISEATQNAKDLDMLYKSIHKILGQVLDVTNFYIAQYDEKEKLLSFPFDIDSEDEFPTTARPLGNGITEYMIKTGKPLLLTKNDINEYKRKGKFEAVGALSEQWMGAPLKIKNKVVGVIAVNSYDDPNLYTKSDLKILTTQWIESDISLLILLLFLSL